MMRTIDTMAWPNFFYVGPGKTGTTTMYHILRGIRGMYVPSVKTTSFFLRRITKRQYLSFYRDVRDEKVVADTSHYYFSSTACRRIHAVRPDAKILITLRDPVEYLFSRFLFNGLTWQRTALTFTQTVDRFIDDDYGALCRNDVDNDQDLLDLRKSNRGYNSETLSMWISAFGRNNVKVILLEDLIQHPRDTVADLLDFVGGGECTTGLDSFALKAHNPFHIQRSHALSKIIDRIPLSSQKRIPFGVREFVNKKILRKVVEKPQMSPSDRRRLQDFLRDDVSETERILGRRLPWENFR